MNPLAHLDAKFDHLITVDFETYYGEDYTLSKMTTEAYVRDPRFECIGVGVQVDDGPTVWTDHEGFTGWAAQVDWSRVAVLAHHTHFDGLILAHHYGIVPAFWFDTMSMGRAIHGIEVGGSLEKLARAYAVGEKGHEVLRAIGKRRADFTPEDYALYGEYCRNDVQLTRRLFDQMVPKLPEAELWNIDSTIRMFTDPTFTTDRELLVQFLQDEEQRRTALFERTGVDRSTFGSNDKFAQLLREHGVDPALKRSPTAKNEDGSPKMTFAFAKSDPFMQDLLDHQRDDLRWFAEARVAAKSSINTTRTKRLIGIGDRGPVPVYLRYHGAHTGRDSGADKMNFQNFPRGGTLRRSLKARDGYELAVADSAQIEARVLAHVAGHADLVEAFAQGRDVYSESASVTYGREVNRKSGQPGDEEAGHVGKVTVLGLGYQMGATAFARALAAGPMGAPPVIFTEEKARAMGVDPAEYTHDPDQLPPNPPRFHLRLAANWRKVAKMPSRLPMQQRLAHWSVAKMIVDTYRAKNQPIVEFWALAERAIEAMCDEREMQIGPCVTERHGLLLPSGRRLRYPGLRRSQTEEIDEVTGELQMRTGYSYVGGYGGERVHLYGGKLVENITQALARDIIFDQALMVRGLYGYHVATRTHDEMVLRVARGEGERALERTLQVMRQTPPWANGCPLKAEGKSVLRYGDAK